MFSGEARPQVNHECSPPAREQSGRSDATRRDALLSFWLAGVSRRCETNRNSFNTVSASQRQLPVGGQTVRPSVRPSQSSRTAELDALLLRVHRQTLGGDEDRVVRVSGEPTARCVCVCVCVCVCICECCVRPVTKTQTCQAVRR